MEQGLEQSRERAKATIMAGIVYVDGQKCDKAGTMIDENANVEVRGKTLKYVSRGGLKLEKAMELWGYPSGWRLLYGYWRIFWWVYRLHVAKWRQQSVCSGCGLWTAGLEAQKRLPCVQYGAHQHSLCNSGTSAGGTGLCFGGCVLISLKLVLPVAYALLKEGGEVVALIKPQFEAGRGKVGKNGVVRDIHTHYEVIENVFAFTAEIGFSICGLTYSPIKGPKGNIEYLMHLKRDGQGEVDAAIDIHALVDASHSELVHIEA